MDTQQVSEAELKAKRHGCRSSGDVLEVVPSPSRFRVLPDPLISNGPDPEGQSLEAVRDLVRQLIN